MSDFKRKTNINSIVPLKLPRLSILKIAFKNIFKNYSLPLTDILTQFTFASDIFA